VRIVSRKVSLSWSGSSAAHSVQRISSLKCSVTWFPYPAPWTIEALDGGFKVVDANKQSLAYVYGHADVRDAEIAKGLTLDEARRIASNIAKLPSLLGKENQE
jgi:hypothetical protein